MPSSPTILYVRLPGMLVCALREAVLCDPSVPVAVSADNVVRDVCPLAARCGVRAGEPISRARRLCPVLLVVPTEGLEQCVLSAMTERFLNVLADHTPIVEPDGHDAAYADFAGGPVPASATLNEAWRECLQTGFAPVMGWGACRNAARACAECDLAPAGLSNANARHLWPEDPAVAARLFRLGLSTYGAVAAIGESALVYQFGKMGRLIYQRSIGYDFLPVRALYPPLHAESRRDFGLESITEESHLLHVLGEISTDLNQQLRQMGRHARCLLLTVQTEYSTYTCEWVLPLPVQQEQDIVVMLRRLRRQITISAPVVSVTVAASHLDLPPATTGSLFDSRTLERKLALASTRQRLHARYGTKALRRLGEIPVPRRETRRTLRQERPHNP